MRLTEQSRYALRVLAHCAERHPALAKVATIAAVTGITEQNIFKLIKTLTKAGFVERLVQLNAEEVQLLDAHSENPGRLWPSHRFPDALVVQMSVDERPPVPPELVALLHGLDRGARRLARRI